MPAMPFSSFSFPLEPFRAATPTAAHDVKRFIITTAVVAAIGLGVLGLSGCVHRPSHSALTRWQAYLSDTSQPPPRLWLLGEQHNAPEHPQWQAHTVQWLAQRGQLAAVVLEMADAGHSTQGLAPHASAEQVQHALHWNDAAWPWQHYGPVVMTALRWGVPVYGGNLPRSAMKEVQRQTHWDRHLDPAAWQRQQQAIRVGHCGLLPESQIVPMTRIQLARDESLARMALQVQRPAQTVVLIAGFAHVQRSVGIPTWLPNPTHFPYHIAIAQAESTESTEPADSTESTESTALEFDYLHRTPALASQDECAALRG